MDASPFAAPKFEVLRGERAYGALLRTKPYFSNEQFLVHIRVQDRVENRACDTLLPIDASNDAQKTHPPTQQVGLVLGLIVPKKRYALAVDRNRVKRIARAHARHLAIESVVSSQSMLVRVKSNKKGAPASTASLAEKNPHSAVFAQQLRHAMSSAWQRTNIANFGF